MRDQNAANLLAKVMGWEDLDAVTEVLPTLQLLADFKYDHYQQFGPGRRFIESLALWLHQFDPADRKTALELVETTMRAKVIDVADPDVDQAIQLAQGECGIVLGLEADALVDLV